MEPGCGKKLHVFKFGVRRLIPGCSNEIFGHFRQCILRFHGWRVPRILLSTRRHDSLHPTRASERTRARRGPARRHMERVSEPTTEFSTNSSTFEFRSVAIARHISSGRFSSRLGLHPLLRCDSKYCCGCGSQAFRGGRPGSKHSHGQVFLPLSETAFNGFVILLFFFAWRISLGVGIMFVYWAGEISVTVLVPSLSRRCSMSIA